MTTQQRGLILLIKSAITGQAYTLPEDFDINKAFETAKKHGITALVYYGAYNCGVDSKSDAMKENSLLVYKQMMICANQDAEIQRLLDAFEANGIKYMPLKGIHLRKLFPKPEMRRMGDADILVKMEQYDRTRQIMFELGYTEGEETGHELHWAKKGSNIELHKCLIAPSSKDYYAYFGDGWNLAKVNDGSSKYLMTDEDEFVYIFAHFAKHYRAAGIGIRHILDIQVLKAALPSLNEEYVCDELSKLGLLEFYKNVTETLKVWFEDAPIDDKTDFITQVIFTSGEYGKFENHQISLKIKANAHKDYIPKKHTQIASSIFVNYDRMSTEYPILLKLPILLPIMWIAYFFKRLFEKNRLKHFVSDISAYKDSDISNYQKNLRYVGLDFNFKDDED